MKEIDLEIKKAEVYKEVEQTTAYTGAKMEGGDDKVFDRISTTEYDRNQLERFWNESCATASEALREFIKTEKSDLETYRLCLGLSESFEDAMEPAIRKELFSFFVISIAGKWYAFTNKGEAGAYASEAMEMLESVRRKVYHRKRPKRPARRV